MKCGYCGAKLRRNDKYCPVCGNRVGLRLLSGGRRVKCQFCGAEMRSTDEFCPVCGKAPASEAEGAAEAARCSYCGAALRSIDAYCPNCGNPVLGSSGVAAGSAGVTTAAGSGAAAGGGAAADAAGARQWGGRDVGWTTLGGQPDEGAAAAGQARASAGVASGAVPGGRAASGAVPGGKASAAGFNGSGDFDPGFGPYRVCASCGVPVFDNFMFCPECGGKPVVIQREGAPWRMSELSLERHAAAVAEPVDWCLDQAERHLEGARWQLDQDRFGMSAVESRIAMERAVDAWLYLSGSDLDLVQLWMQLSGHKARSGDGRRACGVDLRLTDAAVAGSGGWDAGAAARSGGFAAEDYYGSDELCQHDVFARPDFDLAQRVRYLTDCGFVEDAADAGGDDLFYMCRTTGNDGAHGGSVEAWDARKGLNDAERLLGIVRGLRDSLLGPSGPWPGFVRRRAALERRYADRLQQNLDELDELRQLRADDLKKVKRSRSLGKLDDASYQEKCARIKGEVEELDARIDYAEQRRALILYDCFRMESVSNPARYRMNLEGWSKGLSSSGRRVPPQGQDEAKGGAGRRSGAAADDAHRSGAGAGVGVGAEGGAAASTSGSAAAGGQLSWFDRAKQKLATYSPKFILLVVGVIVLIILLIVLLVSIF